jgi:hypothetical protein
VEQVADYYFKMAEMHGSPEAAMAYTLEMFEGLTEAQIDHAVFYRATESQRSEFPA